MRCDASWRGGESCFSRVCCSLQLEEMCVCVSPSFLCWFAAPSVSFLCRPQSVLARFRFLCSQLSAQREKGKNKRVGSAGGMVAGKKPSSLPLALARTEEYGDGSWGRVLVAAFSWESLAPLWSPLLRYAVPALCHLAGHPLLERKAGKTRFIPSPPAKCGLKH